MYPSKGMQDYMTEMNRLFPRHGENDDLLFPSTPNTNQPSFSQSSLPRSSTSPETSPETFPDMTFHRYLSETFHPQFQPQREHSDQLNPNELQHHQYEQLKLQKYETPVKSLVNYDIPVLPQHVYETPEMGKNHRPIFGRKIIEGIDNQLTMKCEDSNWELAEDSLLLTPPKACTDQRFNQNLYYELFPTKKKVSEFVTPVKMSPNSKDTPPKMSSRMSSCPRMVNMSPNMTTSPTPNMYQRMMEMTPRMSEMSRMPEMSPRMTDLSPRMTEMSPRMTELSPRMTEMSPRMAETLKWREMSPTRKTSPGSSTSSHSLRFSTSFKDPILGPSTSFRPNSSPSKMCTFCRKNGETPLVYMTHTVKEKVGNKNIVTCPILRSHVCTTCGAYGDNAHTITYCPVLRSHNNGQPLQSTTITLKNTRIKSNGRRRY